MKFCLFKETKHLLVSVSHVVCAKFRLLLANVFNLFAVPLKNAATLTEFTCIAFEIKGLLRQKSWSRAAPSFSDASCVYQVIPERENMKCLQSLLRILLCDRKYCSYLQTLRGGSALTHSWWSQDRLRLLTRIASTDLWQQALEIFVWWGLIPVKVFKSADC